MKTRTFANVLGDSKCECADKGCPYHKGTSDCRNVGNTILYRIDMEDNSGTVFCDDCANDATMCGLFAEWNDPAFDEYDSDDTGPCPGCMEIGQEHDTQCKAAFQAAQSPVE